MKKRNKGGRPQKYKEVATMKHKIEEYFESCFTPARDRNGRFLRDEKRKNN